MRIIVLFFTYMLFLSCSQKKFDSKERLLEYLQNEDNDYIQKKTVNGVNFSLMYRPTDLVVLQELGSDGDVYKIDNLRKKYNAYVYFNLSMSKNETEILSLVANDKQKFGLFVNQFSFNMDQKINLITESKDTLEMVDYIYPRMYGTSKSTTFLFVFERNKLNLNSEYLKFNIKDLNIQTGEVNFKIPLKIFKDEPRLFAN